MNEAPTTENSSKTSAASTTGPAGAAPAAKAAAGLQGVIAAPSAICFIDGNAGRLVYRGYEITDLVGQVSFEETASLLWD
jgi:citrate synthase